MDEESKAEEIGIRRGAGREDPAGGSDGHVRAGCLFPQLGAMRRLRSPMLPKRPPPWHPHAFRTASMTL